MKIVDLTLEITSNMVIFSGDPTPISIEWSKFDIQGYVSECLFLSTHTGTHMDAPFHFSPNGLSIDQIEVNRFICNDTLLLRIEKDCNQLITTDDILGNTKNEIKEKDTVVLHTGWETRNKEKDMYLKNNPGLSDDAAEYLVKKKVNAVAIDGPSIDVGINRELPAHKILLSNNILVIENLCNLDRLNNQNITVIITPLKLVGASGSPVRAIGIEE
ncbi:MAG: cyclase family protein [Nitrososphaeraceae archaeon]|jgi:kynurenine formamidase